MRGISKARRGVSWGRLAAVAALGPLVVTAPVLVGSGQATADPAQQVIVQFGNSPSDAAALVQSVLPAASAVTSLDSTNGVAVSLPSNLIGTLSADGASVTPDEQVTFQGGVVGASCPSFSTYSQPTGQFRADSGANLLSALGDTGRGVTVALIDTGINASLPDFAGRVVGGVDLTGGNSPFSDEYGHGTFVAGLIAGNGASSGGQYPGEAPGANLVSIKVAGADGSTNIATIVQGISWAISHRNQYGIKVLNLSIGAIPTGPTATEPMDQAVEAAWNAGITVIVAAGNSGPNAGTITSPGDDPLAVTVGAFADNNSRSPADWSACPFSSVGPTLYDGWLKPDLVAPGRSVISVLDPGSTIAQQNPGSVIGTGNFVGSGTSESTAITAGAAALVLSHNPGNSPNQVKGRLLANALPGETTAPLIEGHGFLNALFATLGLPFTYNQAAAAQAEQNTQSGTPVDLGTTWAPSSWNPANYSPGSQWTGSQWTGSQWT